MSNSKRNYSNPLSIPPPRYSVSAMWFLVSILIILWITGYITFGPAAYWVDLLLLAALALIAIKFLRGIRSDHRT